MNPCLFLCLAYELPHWRDDINVIADFPREDHINHRDLQLQASQQPLRGREAFLAQ